MTDLHLQSDLPGDICDLCGSTNPVTVYQCRDFGLDPSAPPLQVGVKAINAVRACAECAALIDADDWDGLADRGVEVLESMIRAGRVPSSSLSTRQYVEMCHGIFRNHKMRHS